MAMSNEEKKMKKKDKDKASHKIPKKTRRRTRRLGCSLFTFTSLHRTDSYPSQERWWMIWVHD